MTSAGSLVTQSLICKRKVVMPVSKAVVDCAKGSRWADQVLNARSVKSCCGLRSHCHQQLSLPPWKNVPGPGKVCSVSQGSQCPEGRPALSCPSANRCTSPTTDHKASSRWSSQQPGVGAGSRDSHTLAETRLAGSPRSRVAKSGLSTARVVPSELSRAGGTTLPHDSGQLKTGHHPPRQWHLVLGALGGL